MSNTELRRVAWMIAGAVRRLRHLDYQAHQSIHSGANLREQFWSSARRTSHTDYHYWYNQWNIDEVAGFWTDYGIPAPLSRRKHP